MNRTDEKLKEGVSLSDMNETRPRLDRKPSPTVNVHHLVCDKVLQPEKNPPPRFENAGVESLPCAVIK